MALCASALIQPSSPTDVHMTIQAYIHIYLNVYSPTPTQKILDSLQVMNLEKNSFIICNKRIKLLSHILCRIPEPSRALEGKINKKGVWIFKKRVK